MSLAQTYTTPRAPTDQVENIKDTIESLVIAFILAFVFRGFLVEAFVIPTGSMAPTLFGKHGTQICSECGWEYAYGLPDRHPEREKIKCPNCDWETASHEFLPYHVSRRGCAKYKDWFQRPSLKPKSPEVAERISHLSFEPKSGDRILVFKWPFDLGGPLLEAQRWDVVVFKNPKNGEDNYIKRLVGVPNEVLEIIDGDIYTCSVDKLDAKITELLNDLIEAKYQLIQPKTGGRRGQLGDLQKKLTTALNTKYRIQRKTSIAQEALWRVVFHQDYLPREAQRKRPPPRWQTHPPTSVTRWNTSQPRIRFDGLEKERQTIAFAGKQIEDFYAYNHGSRMSESSEPVGDLRMKFVLEYTGGTGVLGLRLSKHDDVFVVEFDPNGEVVLESEGASGPDSEPLRKIGHMLPWKIGAPIEIEFGMVDYRVYVKINGETAPLLETTDADYAPNIAELRTRTRRPPQNRRSDAPRAQIYADHLDLTLAHLVLERDVHYKSSARSGNSGHLPWGTTGSPIYLRDGEHFMLGDNSPASQDSRLWTQPGDYLLKRGMDYQIGTVPADQLIGKAFFVYWPSGHRLGWLPVLKNFGVIPSVGKMRWIR